MSLLTVQKLATRFAFSCRTTRHRGALSDVDALLGALDRLIAKKRDLKQAAMQQLLTGQTRLPGFHGEWEVKRLGELFEITSSKRVFQSEWQSEGIPFSEQGNWLSWVKRVAWTMNYSSPNRCMHRFTNRSRAFPKIGDMLGHWCRNTRQSCMSLADEQEFYFRMGNIIWFKIRGKVSAELLRQLHLTQAWS